MITNYKYFYGYVVHAGMNRQETQKMKMMTKEIETETWTASGCGQQVLF